MASKKNDQKSILRLEEEVTNLTEELCQCQADKEFVWSLWKRLQVANPDITQAISLVVEREKIKSEAKDRKVLEILQVKDGKIQELEKRASGQQQEINNLVQRKMAVDEENILLKKELSDLQQELKDKSQELKTAKESTQKNEEQCKTDLEKLAQENEELNKRCSDLHSDLEKARKQEAQWRREKSSIDAKIKEVEVDLKDARREIEVMHSKNNELSSQVAVKQMELAQKQVDVSKLRKELQDLQNLYKQSNEYAAQQAELIQQLQSLNMDTQKVLRSQEDAHTTETISYQKLYNDLNTCYETVKSSETQLRQNNFALTEQLHQREQQVSHLQIQLQDALNALSKSSDEPKTTEQPSLEELELIIASQKSEIKFLQDRLKAADFQMTKVDTCGSGAPDNSILRARKQEMPPVKRSRSLSPMGFSREEEELKKLKIAEKRIEHLEKALQIKIQENAGIRKAHDKRKERFISLQTNFKVVTDQFKKSEKGCINENGKNSETPRAEFWQLRHEDSDAVWNELAHFRREQQKLLVDKMNLEEEIDQLKVQLSSDKATIQELKSCLQEEREVLLLRLSKDETVKSSTPKKNTEDTLQRALQKINHLSQKLKELEPETRKLQEANEELTKEKHSLKTTIKHLQREADVREQKLATIILENQEVKEARDKLEMKDGELTREIKSLKRLLSEEDKLRNENRDLRRQLWTLQHTLKQTKVTNLASRGTNKQNKQKEVRAKVKQSATKKISLRRHQAFLNQSIKVMSSMFENFSKDGWENVSEDSDSENESSGSLGQVILKSTQTACSSLGETSTMEESTTDEFTDNKDIAPEKVPRTEREIKKEEFILKYNTSPMKTVQREKKNKTTSFKQGISMTALRDRIASLQHKVTVLQRGKRAATESANEFKKAKIELAAELHLAHQRLLISKQMLKKLSLELTELQREKEYMEQNVEQMKLQLAQFKRSSEVQCPVTSDLSPAIPLTPSKNIDPEMKQLQNKLKSMTTESTKQSSAIKSLRSEVHEKEERIQELQERAARMERDVNMKRHLIEDLKTRLKAYQENERPRQEMLESLERKVKTLSEECSQKKTSIDSLRQRLSIATKEKAQHEQMYRKVQEEMDKKRLRITDLESKVTQTELAMNELEKAATQQLHNLAIQSEQSMEVVQDKLLHVTRRADDLVTFVKHLAKTLQIDICEIRSQIRQAKIMQESKSGPSKESVNRAQSLAASILNISRSDLNEILDVHDGQEIADLKKSLECDKDWMNHIVKLLEGQFPFESNLMDAILDKLDEKKKLIVEHTLLKRDM